MSSKRVFFAMLAVAGLLVALAVFVTFTGRGLIVAEGEKLTDLKLEQKVLDKRSTALLQAKKDITEYEDLEQIARSVVPQDKDQARTVVEIVNIARELGISVTSIAFPDSLLGQVSRGSRRGTTTDPNLTQLTPLTSPKGVYSMEIRIETDGDRPVPYARLLNFLSRLENNRRTAQVTNISISPDEDNRNLITFTLTLTTYVKP